MHIAEESGVGGWKKVDGKIVYNESTEKFKRLIDWIIGEPAAYVFLMGDIFNTGIIGSKSDIYREQYKLDDAVDYATELLSPLAKTGRLIGGVDGNHEYRLIRMASVSLVKNLIDKLNQDSPTDKPIHHFPNQCAYLFFKIGDNKDWKSDRYRPYTYTILFHHGRGGGRTDGSKVNNLSAMTKMAPADIYIMGHVHMKFVMAKDFPQVDIIHSKVFTEKRYFMISGGWLGYAPYAIEKMYEPATIGVGRIRLNAEPLRGKDIKISI
ncbi:MAG: metallophosphoesterase [Eubacteriales bacterium]